MFTGIVQGLGHLSESLDHGEDRRMTFVVPPSILSGAQTGDSMCVSGACLTMLDIRTGRFSADVSVETLDRTTLGRLETGQAVNLEPALRAADRLGGHLVSGHVDAVAWLQGREVEGRSERFDFKVPNDLARYLASKGSVCVDGTSLTINIVEGDRFSVNLIPHTLEVTTLGGLRPGDPVNLEVDMIARYVERLLEPVKPEA